MTNRPNPRALAAARLCENYAHAAQAALDHLGDELRAIDWHPSATLGDGTPRGTSDDSPAERPAMQRLALQAKVDQIQDDITTIASLVGSALVVANDALGTRASKDRPTLCSSAGREGAIEWGNPTCINLPVRGPLCEACWRREYRWRKSRELPGRNDEFAA